MPVRNKDDLAQEARDLGIAVPDYWHTRDIMDALRQKIGTFDPALQLDPAKAYDLKKDVNWLDEDPFAKIRLTYLNGRWVLEPKLDGVRVRGFLGATGNTFNSGRRSVKTYAYVEKANHFPHLRDAVDPALAGTIIDGELMPPAGVTSIMTGIRNGVEQWTQGSLNTIMAIFGSGPDKAVARQKEYGQCIFMAFDILALNGADVTSRPLHERRKMLETVIEILREKSPCFQIVEQLDATGENIMLCVQNGFEGAMLKRRESPYVPGKRMQDWRKIKTMSAGDFFIIGSIPGTGKNLGKVGSLKVAYWDEQAGLEATVYCADVSGMTDQFRDEITDPETGKVREEWMYKVIEVMAQGVTKNRRLRHPHFKRVRDDKTPQDCDPASSIELFTDV